MPQDHADKPAALEPAALCWRCAGEDLDFESSDELEDLSEVIGQERAVEAIRFAVGMERPGYNLYALGPEGTGRHSLVRLFLEEHARAGDRPADWCYISNFRDRRKPRALRLAAGRGRVFQADMTRFVDDLRDALRSAFESDEHRTRRQVIEEELKERQEKALAEIEKDAQDHSLALLRTPMGFAFAPVSDGKVISPEIFQHFPRAERKRIEEYIETLQKRLQKALEQAPVWMKETRDKLRTLNRETAMFAVGHLVKAVREGYQDVPEVLSYLDEVQQDVIENVEQIVVEPEKPEGAAGAAEFEDGHPIKRRYRVNLLVDNQELEHRPVVYEDDPTFDRLVGRIEHRAEMGTLLTDFHLIRAGALHRANGGYLIIDARSVC